MGAGGWGGRVTSDPKKYRPIMLEKRWANWIWLKAVVRRVW